MAYEILTENEIQHRHPSKYFLGKADPITEPTHIAQYEDEGEWFTLIEGSEEECIAYLARPFVRDGASPKRIVLVIPAPKTEAAPVADEEVEVTPEASEVVEQSIEASTASTDAVATAKPATKTYMEWNNATHRYEAEIDGKLFCVEEDTFADRFAAACSESSDDEYRIWGVLTWLSSWDFSGKVSGAYILETANV